MKNKRILFFGSTLCALVLFSCATGNKVSKVSFGGGWAEATSTPKTEVPAVVVTENPVTATTGIAESANPVSEDKAVVNSTGKTVTHPGMSTESEVPATKAVKTGLKHKLAAKMISKQLQKPHDTNGDKLLYVIIAILIPWLGVLLYEGGVTSNFWITLLLWFLFYLPGLIYALLVILDYI